LDRKVNDGYSSKFRFDDNLFNGIGKILLTNPKTKNEKLTLIPYYSWANRKIGEMAVWLKYE